MIDLGDATLQAIITGGGTFNATEFFLRLNIPGMGRFAISLYGETKRAFEIRKTESEAKFAKREMIIVENYLSGLKLLSELYDDKELINFIDDFKNSDMYIQAFQKSGQLAVLRKVPEDKILRTKSDIDSYFRR